MPIGTISKKSWAAMEKARKVAKIAKKEWRHFEETYFQKHPPVYQEDMPYRCARCGGGFETGKEQAEHIKKMHGPRKRARKNPGADTLVAIDCSGSSDIVAVNDAVRAMNGQAHKQGMTTHLMIVGWGDRLKILKWTGGKTVEEAEMLGGTDVGTLLTLLEATRSNTKLLFVTDGEFDETAQSTIELLDLLNGWQQELFVVQIAGDRRRMEALSKAGGGIFRKLKNKGVLINLQDWATLKDLSYDFR